VCPTSRAEWRRGVEQCAACCRAPRAMADDAGGDDVFSFQDGTMVVEDRREFAAVNGAAADGGEQNGLRSGWKSERVSGNEIRQRLSALVQPSASAVAVDSSGGGQQAPSARPPSSGGRSASGAADPSEAVLAGGTGSYGQGADRDLRSSKDGRAALEDRTGDITTGVSVESWGALLAGEKLTVQSRSKADLSLDINEAEQLLAASPTAATQMQLPLGLVSHSKPRAPTPCIACHLVVASCPAGSTSPRVLCQPQAAGEENQGLQDVLSFEAKRVALGRTGQQVMHGRSAAPSPLPRAPLPVSGPPIWHSPKFTIGRGWAGGRAD